MTLREILEAALAELSRVLGAADEAEAARLEAALLAAPRVFVAGAGRSGLMVRAFGQRLMHLGLTVHVVGEVTTPAIGAGDLLLLGSGSGETGSLMVMARRARALGAEVALVTIAPDSSLGRLAGVAVRLSAPSPKLAPSPDGRAAPPATLPLGSLFEEALLVLLDALALRVGRARGIGAEEMFGRHANLE